MDVIRFGEVPSVYQMDTIKQMVGPIVAPLVNPQNTAALAGRDVLERTSSDWPRINEYFARLNEDGKTPASGYFDAFTLYEYPAAWLAAQVDLRRPVTGENTISYVSGKNRLIHRRLPANSIQRPALNVQA